MFGCDFKSKSKKWNKIVRTYNKIAYFRVTFDEVPYCIIHYDNDGKNKNTGYVYFKWCKIDNPSMEDLGDLLHEIGHDQTIFFLTSFKYNWDFLIAFLVERPSINYFMYWLRCQIYYRLPCEWAATEWAIDFINNNIKEVRELETYITEVKND